MKTYFYAVRVEELPRGFQDEIARLNLAQKGVWETNAANAAVAEEQIIRFVRMMTREVIEPDTLEVKRTTALLNEIATEVAAPPVEAVPVAEIVKEPVVEIVSEPIVEIIPETVPETQSAALTLAPMRSRRWIDWLLGRRGWWTISSRSSEASAAAN